MKITGLDYTKYYGDSSMECSFWTDCLREYSIGDDCTVGDKMGTVIGVCRMNESWHYIVYIPEIGEEVCIKWDNAEIGDTKDRYMEYDGKRYDMLRECRKGDTVLLMDTHGNMWTTECIASAEGFPLLFKDDRKMVEGIGFEVIGVCDDRQL